MVHPYSTSTVQYCCIYCTRYSTVYIQYCTPLLYRSTTVLYQYSIYCTVQYHSTTVPLYRVLQSTVQQHYYSTVALYCTLYTVHSRSVCKWEFWTLLEFWNFKILPGLRLAFSLRQILIYQGAKRCSLLLTLPGCQVYKVTRSFFRYNILECTEVSGVRSIR